jgi:hypothetical protein
MRLRGLRVEAAAQFVPEAVVGPVLDLLVERALHVVAAAGVRTHAAQGEAALVVGVDQLVADRRHLGQQAEPAEGIDALETARWRLRHAGAADAVEAVAAGDEVAFDLVASRRPSGR